MRQRLFCALVSFAGISMASAAPLCTAGPVNLTPSTVINCGGLTFSNFDVIAAAPGTLPTVSYVNSAVSDGNVTINFNPGLSGSAGVQDLWFYFTLSGSPVQSVKLTVGGTNATVDEVVCDAPIASTGAMANVCSGATLANMAAFSAPNTSSANATVASPGALHVFKDIGVGKGGELSSFSQTYGTTGQASVPEPVSASLLGVGLLALLYVRRRAT